MLKCFTNAANRLEEIITAELRSEMGQMKPEKIVIKPNWVLHETDPTFPISALVTDSRVIDATVRACLKVFPGAERITVGDCPLQRADWPLLCRQSGLVPTIQEFTNRHPDQVFFRDLRKEIFDPHDGFLVPDSTAPHGDPEGYVEVLLGSESHLESISDQAERFSIHDHNTSVTRANHRNGDHRYCVCRTMLEADLLINIPKWKTHSKAAITGALKNLVGINGDKAYLPHFRSGAPRWGGDEYWDEGRWLYWLQNNVRELLRRKSRLAYRSLQPCWSAFKRLRKMITGLAHRQRMSADFYVGGGSWYGNQTIWRMIYDLNMVIQRVDRRGRLQPTPQRRYFCIVDGLTCGEGDGPLHPRPRDINWLVCGNDPFAIDTTLAWFMGFDCDKIPILARRHEYMGPDWGDFDPPELALEIDGRSTRVVDENINLEFQPPPGWKDHVERASYSVTLPAV
jgi:hypothetical protein